MRLSCRVSTAKVSGSQSAKQKPDFYEKLEDFATSSEDESSLIVELVNVGDCFKGFKGEPTLLLEASDLNSNSIWATS